jgi:hypothetical protein
MRTVTSKYVTFLQRLRDSQAKVTVVRQRGTNDEM